MSVDGWNTVLVLGGIRSGKSEFAEALVADAPSVRYVATAAAGDADAEWTARIAAHQRRRRTEWTTEEVGADPGRLASLIAEAKPDETLLVDDLGGWVAARLARAGDTEGQADAGDTEGRAGAGDAEGQAGAGDAEVAEATDADPVRALVAAIHACAARLVLVSPEVGLSLVPTTPVGRAFTDALGTTNRAVADAVDAVVLVVAGQASWLKPTAAEVVAVAAAETAAPARPIPPAARPIPPAVRPIPPVVRPHPQAEPATATTEPAVATTEPAAAPVDALSEPTMSLPVVATGLVLQPGMELPMPDEEATAGAHTRLASLDLAGAGLGELARVVTFAAGTQGTAEPRAWRSPRVLVLSGEHAGGAAAGSIPGDAERRAGLARDGGGPLGVLADRVGATIQVVDAPPARPMELESALDSDEVDEALRYGWRLAEEAVDAGVDVLVIGSCGTGTDAAAAAVLAAIAGAEAAAVLPRVITPGGRVDDAAWMVRCAAVRDALSRIRHSPRGAQDVLAEVGGGDVAIATGILLGATARRTPVLLDGPVGVAAALVSRDLAGQARHWCLLPDHGGNPTVKLAADVLGLTPFTELRLDAGEGATALAALPLLTAALGLAAALPTHPAAPADANPDPDSGGPAADTGPDGQAAGEDWDTRD